MGQCKDFFIYCYFDTHLQFKTNHRYYQQIQHQMFLLILHIPILFLFVNFLFHFYRIWTPLELISTNAMYNVMSSFWNHHCCCCCFFFFISHAGQASTDNQSNIPSTSSSKPNQVLFPVKVTTKYLMIWGGEVPKLLVSHALPALF